VVFELREKNLQDTGRNEMTTLFDATLELAKILMPVVEGTGTSGSATTLADTARTEPDDHFNQGTIFMRSGTDIGESAIITDFENTGGIFTFAALDDADPTGNLYSACERDYPRWLLIQAINEALQDFDLPKKDTSLVTVDDQEAYDLPAGIRNITRVEIATDTSSPYDYKIHYNWTEVDDDLWFDEGYEPHGDDYKIRLTYNAAHAALTADSGEVDPYVHIRALKWLAAVHALRWRYRARGREKKIEAELEEARAMAEIMRGKYKTVDRMARDPHHANW